MTPLDKLASLPEAASFLRSGVTLLELQQLARALTAYFSDRGRLFQSDRAR
jgi:hypothetical protein